MHATGSVVRIEGLSFTGVRRSGTEHVYKVCGADDRTTAGVRIGIAPILLLAPDVEPTELGKAIRTAFEYSEDGIEHPANLKSLLIPLLECAKVRSCIGFQKAASNCGVEAARRGYKGDPKQTRRCCRT